MFRKIVCILIAAVCIFSFSIPVLAGGRDGRDRLFPGHKMTDSSNYTDHSVTMMERNVAQSASEFYRLDITAYPIRAERKGLAQSKNYPAPIIMAMALSFFIVVLMLFVDSRRN